MDPIINKTKENEDKENSNKSNYQKFANFIFILLKVKKWMKRRILEKKVYFKFYCTHKKSLLIAIDPQQRDNLLKKFWSYLDYFNNVPELDEAQHFWLEKIDEDSFDFVKIYDSKTTEFGILKIFKGEMNSQENKKKLELMKVEDDIMKKIEGQIRSREANIQEYFLKYGGIFKDSKKTNSILFKTEYWCSNLEKVLKAGKVYSCSELVHVLTKLVEGFALLEEFGIPHRDIRPQNIVFVESNCNGRTEFFYKITNFSLSTEVTTIVKEIAFTPGLFKGKPNDYSAPEVRYLREKNLEAVYKPFLADVYSLGVVLFKMIKPNWDPMDLKPGLLNNKEVMKGYEEILVILKGMLEEDISKRWSFKQILEYLKNHPEIVTQIPTDEAHFCYKSKREFEDTKNELEKWFESHKNLYLTYIELSRLKEAKFFLDIAWENLEKRKKVQKNENDKTLLEQELFCYNAFGDWYTQNGSLALAEQNLDQSMQKFKAWQEKTGGKGRETHAMKTMKAYILRLMGNLNLAKGNLVKTEECYNESLKIYEGISGEKNAEVATAYNKLGTLQFHLGNLKKAEDLYVNSMRIRLNLFGDQHIEMAGSYNNLAQLNFHMGCYAEAQDFYGKSLAIFQKYFGENHALVAITYNNLGLLYDQLGEMNKAEEFYFKSLKIRQSLSSEDNSEIAALYNNLGIMYDNNGDLVKAEENYLKSLKILQKIFGDDSINVADLYNNLGVLEFNTGNYSKSEEFYLKALTIRERVFGENHLEVANTLNNLGFLYYKIEKHSQAEVYTLRAVKVREQILGDSHIDVADSLSNLSQIYEALKENKKALDYAEKGYKIAVELLGETDPKTLEFQESIKKIKKSITSE